MVHHVSFAVKDFEKSRDYYDKTLACLGYQRVWNRDTEEKLEAGYGRFGGPEFLIIAKKQLSEQDKREQIGQSAGFHVCFAGADPESVKKWYETCTVLGGKDNGSPGFRFPGYYAGYIVDPDGWRIEACHYNPEG
jgi:catechol 2,3-dioxygenase-like lactoylglutathione lyase family enzyme